MHPVQTICVFIGLMIVSTTHHASSTTVSTSPTTSTTLSPPLVNTSTPAADCQDTINTCPNYGRAPCIEKLYEPWARSHCARFCGFCTSGPSSDCKDQLPNCNEYDSGNLCTAATFYAWAYDNCRTYCKFDQCGGVCKDQEGIDCQSANETSNLCADINRAKHVCPKFCNLCDVVDGLWSTWSDWSGCSVTCGDGAQVRSRSCDNPAPAHGGLTCQGSVREDQSCSMQACQAADGGWGAWGNWSACSASCGTGLQHRERRCDSPRPAQQGDHCFGRAADYRICSEVQCAVTMSAFTVTDPHTAVVGTDLTFTNVVLNQGSDYQVSTGHFICRIPGLYFFTLSLTKKRSPDSTFDLVHCSISKNGVNQVQAWIDPNDRYADDGSYGTTASVTLRLHAGEFVSVRDCTSYTYMEQWSLFSGFLVAPTQS